MHDEKQPLKAKPRRSKGQEKLVPLKSLDLGSCSSFSELARQMSLTAFGGRALGEAVDVTVDMINDKECFKVLTLSGAMTMAKMGLVICDMIDNGMVDAVVSTGALMAHGFVEAAGMSHFKNPGTMTDEELYDNKLDRVYDTLESEDNLDDVSDIVNIVLENLDPAKPASSSLICKELGRYLHENVKGRGVLKSAFERNIPVFIPAFTDSELGLDFGLFNRKMKKMGKPTLSFDPFIDLEAYTSIAYKAQKLGIFTIGGGVPRNWAQQIGPYLDLIRIRLRDNMDPGEYRKPSNDMEDPYVTRFWYAVRICPEPVHFGGLSGCTYSEGVSWGKFVPKSKGGKFAEVLIDATVAWPIIIKAVLERMGK